MKSDAYARGWRSREDCRSRCFETEKSASVPTLPPREYQWVTGKVPTFQAGWWLVPTAILGAALWGRIIMAVL